jgi:hypothetical protein
MSIVTLIKLENASNGYSTEREFMTEEIELQKSILVCKPELPDLCQSCFP